MRDGALLERARQSNNDTYPEVEQYGLGRLCCLSVEVFGRWGRDPLETMETDGGRKTWKMRLMVPRTLCGS